MARAIAFLWPVGLLFGCSFDASGVAAVSADGAARPEDSGARDAGASSDAAPDGDQDGVPDATDNCPEDANAEQYDEDQDGLGDGCDNCPGLANPDQLDELEVEAGIVADGVGDACDPRPARPGERVVFFDGFSGAERDPAWTVAHGDDSWVQEGGLMKQTETGAPSRILYWSGGSLSRAAVDTAMVYDSVPPPGGSRYRLGGVVAQYNEGSGTGTGTGYSCTQIQDDFNETNALHVLRFDNNQIWFLNSGSEIDKDIEVAGEYFHRFTVDGPGNFLHCELSTPPAIEPPEDNDVFDLNYDEGHLGLRTFEVTASFRYVTIYELGGPL